MGVLGAADAIFRLR